MREARCKCAEAGVVAIAGVAATDALGTRQQALADNGGPASHQSAHGEP